MAFTIDSFDNVTSGMSRGPKIWSYGSTTDTLAQTMVAGYFEEVKDRLYKNDLIYVSSIDDVELIKITSENGQTPTTSIFVPASGGAPSDATYITQTPNIDLANEQALSLLASGLLKSQTVTGVISVATPNVDYQVGSPALTSISALTTAADEMIYTTASNTYAITGLTSAGRALLDDPTAGDQRNSLGLGTIATQNSNNVTITGGSITGVTGLVDSVSGTVNRITSTAGDNPVIDIDANYVGQSSITTLGAISSGTWASTAIPVTNGGTGLTTMTTAYAPVISGTTATGNLQVASTGLSTSGYILTSTGSSSLPTFQAPLLKVVVTPMTAAQWLAMYATPLELVPVPGSGLCHIVVSCAIFFNYGGTNQFAAGGAVVLQWGTAANGAGNSPINTMAASNFIGVADSLTMQTVVAKSNTAKSNFDNLSLCLSNQTAAFTGGTNNTLNVVVSYYTVASGWT